MSSAARLSVVLGSYNRLEPLKRCLESILRETRTPVVVYVTDAGSTDGTQPYLQSVASERIRPLLVGRKLGQARAYNDVFRTLDTPYVAWLSDDNEVVDGGLDVAVRILDRRVDGLDLGGLAPAVAKMLLATALMAAACWGVQKIPGYPAGDTRLAWAAQLAILMTVGGAVYVGTCRVTGVTVMDQLLPRRFRRARSDSE